MIIEMFGALYIITES